MTSEGERSRGGGHAQGENAKDVEEEGDLCV